MKDNWIKLWSLTIKQLNVEWIKKNQSNIEE
jgi:hypothetical protein